MRYLFVMILVLSVFVLPPAWASASRDDEVRHASEALHLQELQALSYHDLTPEDEIWAYDQYDDSWTRYVLDENRSLILAANNTPSSPFTVDSKAFVLLLIGVGTYFLADKVGKHWEGTVGALMLGGLVAAMVDR